MKKIKEAGFLLFLIGISMLAGAQSKMESNKSQNEKTVMVGGAEMYPARNIIQNAVNSADHTTLVAAVKAAGLVEVLEGKGPFTVFAPTNKAFDKLPSGTVSTLLLPENKSKLSSVLTYHVVPGKFDKHEIMKLMNGKSSVELKTVEGGNIWIMKKQNSWWLKDEKGGMAKITIADVYQSNGVIHVIDTVLMPE